MRERRQLGTAVTTALLLAAGLRAHEPPPPAARVATLIAQLGSPKSEEREAAARALEALGAPALGPLQEARARGDAEVRRRARLLVQSIEHRVEAERLLQPTRVRLVFKDSPLRDAAADLGRKTGLAVRVEGDAARTIILDTGAVTVWEAVARFRKEAGLTERPTDVGPIDPSQYDPWDRKIIDLDDVRGDTAGRQGQPLILKDEDAPPLPTFQSGAFRLRALPASTPPAGSDKSAGEPRVGLEVRLEPRLRLEAVIAVRIDRAVDEHGQALRQPAADMAGAGALAGGPNDDILIFWDGETALPAYLAGEPGPVSVRLRPAEKPSRWLKELRGTIALQVLAPQEPLVTLNGVQAAGKLVKGRDGSAVKVIEALREPEGPAKLRVEVVPPSRDVFLSGIPARIFLAAGGRWRGRGLPVPPPVASGQLTLFDDRGREVPLVGTPVPSVGSGGTAWVFTLAYQPGPGQGEPTRLVYAGRRAVVIEVPFTLYDVPLP